MKWASTCVLNDVKFKNGTPDYLKAIAISALKSGEISFDQAFKYSKVTQKEADNNKKTNIRQGQRWTIEEELYVRESLLSKKSMDLISVELDRGLNGIKSRVVKMIKNSGKDYKEACVEFNIPYEVLQKRLEGKNEESDEDTKKAKKPKEKKIRFGDMFPLMQELNRKMDLILEKLDKPTS